ncbi:MAG: signal recognition particle-docking protein FtsY [Betaproteobacteria bacterium]
MFGFPKKPTQDTQVTQAQATPSWTERLKSGLSRTRGAIGGLFASGKIDEALYEDLESALLRADCGVDATARLMQALRARVRKERATEASALKALLRDELLKLVAPLEKPFPLTHPKPLVMMIAGVNGAGKTTSIGKLAKYFQSQGKSVLLAAGDTFRAAAREQLVVWGERNGVTVIAQQSGDPSAVIFDAVGAAMARKIDIVMADTAGRLPTQLHLMDEIRKVKRVIAKVMPGAPHEVILVLDANTGQNTLNQVKAFDEAIGLTGLVLTKLDGTAKGGVVAALAHQRSKEAKVRPLPLYFIGVGEGIDDLRPFSARDFVEALVD